ncbi:MAG: hypothetical protein ACK4L4_10275 [Gemmobacter sp.]
MCISFRCLAVLPIVIAGVPALAESPNAQSFMLSGLASWDIAIAGEAETPNGHDELVPVREQAPTRTGPEESVTDSVMAERGASEAGADGLPEVATPVLVSAAATPPKPTRAVATPREAAPVRAPAAPQGPGQRKFNIPWQTGVFQ